MSQLAAYQGSDRQQILEAGARKEGNLSWYTSLAGSSVQQLSDGFKAKYSYIQPNVFRADDQTLISRATQEAQAGKHVMDALEATLDTVYILDAAKLLQPYYSPPLSSIPADYRTKTSGPLATAATDRISFIGFGYNTTLIAENAVPAKLEDLLNPGLSGKLSLAGTTTGYRFVGQVLHAMGDSKGQAFLQQLASKQKPSVQQISGAALLDLIAKGEVPASPTIFRDHAELAASKKSPVKWVGLPPVPADVGQQALAAQAPHPHAALLFIDYALGPEGQQILTKDFYGVPTEKESFTTWIPEEGRTTDQVTQDLNSWSDTFKKLFR